MSGKAVSASVSAASSVVATDESFFHVALASDAPAVDLLSSDHTLPLLLPPSAARAGQCSSDTGGGPGSRHPSGALRPATVAMSGADLCDPARSTTPSAASSSAASRPSTHASSSSSDCPEKAYWGF